MPVSAVQQTDSVIHIFTFFLKIRSGRTPFVIWDHWLGYFPSMQNPIGQPATLPEWQCVGDPIGGRGGRWKASAFGFFSLSFAPSMIYLDGTRKSLMSSISNLPMVPTGKELLPSFYKWGNWASKKIHLNCLLDHSYPSCCNHILEAMFLMNMSF